MADRLTLPAFDATEFSHPVFKPYHGVLARLRTGGGWPSLERLNALAAAQPALRTAGGRPVRFVAPPTDGVNYELRVHATGQVATRAGNWHDLFNALAWLVFPRTKARLNALHAATIPSEPPGRRSRLRDLLTVFDEGGAVIACSAPALVGLARRAEWRELFWSHRHEVVREMQVFVIGHAVLEKALGAWPGIACKTIFLDAPEPAIGRTPADRLAGWVDLQAEAWLATSAPHGTPRALPAIPVFGFPGWLPGSSGAEFYDDPRYFRNPADAIAKTGRTIAAGSRPGSRCRDPMRVRAEESPGSAERDAG